MDWIHYGYRNKEAIKNAIFAVQDLNGSYIYILDPEIEISGIKKYNKKFLISLTNLSQIKKFNVQLCRINFLY